MTRDTGANPWLDYVKQLVEPDGCFEIKRNGTTIMGFENVELAVQVAIAVELRYITEALCVAHGIQFDD